MSSAGRAANSNGCVSKPKEHATGLIGFAAQIRRSSLIGSCAMETAEHREPCESRGSRTDLGAPGVRFLRATRPLTDVCLLLTDGREQTRSRHLLSVQNNMGG